MTYMEIFSRAYDAGDEFSQVIAACEKQGDYCVIGGHGVNAYSYTVFTSDLDLVIASDKLANVTEDLAALGFERWDSKYSVNFRKPGSRLVVQFSTDDFYKDFYKDAQTMSVLDIPVKVASIDKIIASKIAAWSDPQRNRTKRLKDTMDLSRLLDVAPKYRHLFPPELLAQIEAPPPVARPKKPCA